MRYCHGCGAKIEVGDVFCTNCGKKQLQDSPAEEKQFQQPMEHDNYVNSNTERVQQGASNNFYPTSKNQFDFSNGDILLKMLLKPVTGAKQFVESGEKGTAIGITLLLTVMQGLLGVWKVNQFISSLEKMVIDLIQKMSAFMNLIEPGSAGRAIGSNEIMNMTTQINKVKSFINIPYGKIFLQNSALFIISIAILFIIIYLGTNILSKNRSETFTIYKTALIVLVPTLYFEIFSVIFSYLSIYLGFSVAVIGVIISLGCLTIVIKDKLHIDENYSVFIVAISCIVIFIGVSMSLQSFMSSNIADIIMSVTNIMKTLN